ncbi:MAG: ribosome maturation factor RimM [Pseudomonadota bacterium]
MVKEPDGMVCVGAIAGAFGVRGEARIKSFCVPPEAIADYNPLRLADGREFDLKINRLIKAGYAAKLSGVTSKEAADALRGERLYAPRERLPNLPDDEFYHADLIGLSVVDPGGTVLGKVHAVHDHGAGDLLEVLGPGLKGGVMLPFTREVVPTVDLQAGRLIVDPPEGTLE